MSVAYATYNPSRSHDTIGISIRNMGIRPGRTSRFVDLVTLAFAALLILGVTANAFSQSVANQLTPSVRYPIPANPFISDYAALLSVIEENRIQGLLLAARKRQGVEAAVVTVKNRHQYGDHADIESFASGIFYRWDLSAEAHGKSLLLVIAEENRELRIELGRDYPQAVYERMQPIIKQAIIPYFRDGDYATGIERGLERLLLELRRYRDGEEAGLAAQAEVALLRVWLMMRHGDWRVWLVLGLLWAAAGLYGVLRYRRGRKSTSA